ncbi:adenylyltransferase/cytidyltransferase family protein [Candidatus Pacearchaeota archaeon]|nr:adenylyltransferase/cytidyltransferase family protein [Candidatus Pacearchaeota archaeon]
MISNNKIKTIEELETISKELKNQQKIIVTTNGTFDILHYGHVQYLKKSKQQGDILIVLLNSDDSIKRIKGDKRPIINQFNRSNMLASLECVDYVCIYDEDKPFMQLEKIKPQIHTKGAEVKGETRKLLEKWNGKYIPLGIIKGLSTTNVIEKIIDSYTDNNKYKVQIKKDKEKPSLLVDIDGTLCPQAKKGEGYDNLEPFQEAIETINKLYNEGFKIILFTSRFMGYNNGDVLKIYREDGHTYIKNQLNSWGLKYHELHMGKPQSDLIIDDRCIFFRHDWKKIYDECMKLKDDN